MAITIAEAVDFLEAGGEIKLECESGYSYEISDSSNWIGGDVAEGLISQVLGNIVYDLEDAKYVVEKSIKHLEGCGEKVSIIF